jgi:hypothetical protein
MKIGPSQLVVIGAGVLVFCGIVTVRLHQEGAPERASLEQRPQAPPRPQASVTPSLLGRVAAKLAPPVRSSGTAIPEPPGSGLPELEAVRESRDSSGPELPVSLEVDPAPGGDTNRVVLQSRSDKPLSVKVSLSSQKAGYKYTTELTVPPYGTTELDGVGAEHGDRFVVASSGYKDQVIYFE